MNLSEFELHRPILGRQLRMMLEEAEGGGAWSNGLSGNWEFGWTITPVYEGGIQFKAKHPVIHSLVCVGPEHPKSMCEEDAPGSRGTWWWEEDIS